MRGCKGSQIIKRLAKQNGVTIEEIRQEIELAIDIAINSKQSNAIKYWDQYLKSNGKPTPEDFIEHLTKGL